MRGLFLLLSIAVGHLFYAQDKTRLSFSPEGGIYNEALFVELESDSGASIFYTIDGTIPRSGSIRYRSPIEAKGTTVIRAVAYLKGKRSEVITATYFTDRKYSLPVISIATNPENLFDYTSGIYAMGCCADTVEPYMGANFMREGWEKPINIEMYESTGEQCFNQRAGIRIFGGYSRMLPQKSFAIIARSRYGKNRFKYPIFQERKHKEYKSFVLRNSGGDFRRTHFRDAFMTQMAKPTGIPIQAYRPSIVYVNGVYWGILNLREKINEHYLEQNYDADPDLVDLLNHRGTLQHGSTREYKKFLSFLRRAEMESDAVVNELATRMDIKGFINYNIAEVYSDNRDAGGNIRYWKERKDSSQWRWILFDLDLGLNNNHKDGYKNNTLENFTRVNNEIWPDPPWSTFIIRSLLRNKKLQTEYINMFADRLNTVYHPDTAMALLERMAKGIEPEIAYHQKRWSSSLKSWHKHIESVRFFVKTRPYEVRKHLMQKFELTDTALITIKYPGAEKAKLEFNSIKIKRDFSGIYFVNVPVHITVTPTHDFVFEGWKEREEKDKDLWVNVTGDLVLEPLLKPKKSSSCRDSIIFNEVCYFQMQSDTSQDWVELYNRSKEQVDLSGWRFTDSEYKEGWIFPENTVLKPESFLIISENRGHYNSTYSLDSSRVVGGFERGISAAGEHIKLYDKQGFMVDSLTVQSMESDSAMSLNRTYIDSLGSAFFRIEAPSPGKHSAVYRNYLKQVKDEKYWKRIFYIGGGGFFFILVAGLLSFRYYKKRKRA